MNVGGEEGYLSSWLVKSWAPIQRCWRSVGGGPSPFFLLLATVLHIVQQHFRFRYDRLHKNNSTPPSTVLANLLSYDLPYVTRLSLELGQFRTFGIPTISRLLHATREYEDSCGRRYDDTDLILREILENGSTSERARKGEGVGQNVFFVLFFRSQTREKL